MLVSKDENDQDTLLQAKGTYEEMLNAYNEDTYN